jgi:putative Mn2+ efflux pump MntP
MNFFVVLAIALALAMDAFAVSIGVSLMHKGLTRGQTFRLSFHFGFFQFIMPLLGWAAGRNILKYIEAYDHWVAAGLLVFVGGRMIFESFGREARLAKKSADLTKGFSLVVLSVATSLDALAVGLSLAALHAPILYPAAVIGFVAFMVTASGTKVGPALGRLIGKRAELAGGLVLILIAIKILADHL